MEGGTFFLAVFNLCCTVFFAAVITRGIYNEVKRRSEQQEGQDPGPGGSGLISLSYYLLSNTNDVPPNWTLAYSFTDFSLPYSVITSINYASSADSYNNSVNLLSQSYMNSIVSEGAANITFAHDPALTSDYTLSMTLGVTDGNTGSKSTAYMHLIIP